MGGKSHCKMIVVHAGRKASRHEQTMRRRGQRRFGVEAKKGVRRVG